ncbi:MAG: hypothetical protein Ct9H300mP19_06300 [Dehalococcoidia bacterium]|nr:MAG: hypothetical protein Ct9H300mP19_06300 [Dehalococcoidia bacterium]
MKTYFCDDGDVLNWTIIPEKLSINRAGHIFAHGLGMWDESGNVIGEKGVSVTQWSRNSSVLKRFHYRGTGGKTKKIVSAGFVHMKMPIIYSRKLQMR